MSALVIGLLVAGYFALLVLVLCVLTIAKRADEAGQWAAEPADPAPFEMPARADGALALTDVHFVGRFARKGHAETSASLPPQIA